MSEVVENSVQDVQLIDEKEEEKPNAEKTQQRDEQKFRTVFESASDMMIILDRSGRILDINRKGVELFGGSKDELSGKHFARVMVGIVSPKDIPRVTNVFLEGLAGKKPTLNVSIRSKKGQVFHLEASNTVLRTDDKFVGLLVIARDVTERRKREGQIRESQEKLQNIFAASPDAVTISDLSGNIVECNQATLDMLEFSSKQELIGKNGFSLIAKKDQQKAAEHLKKTLEHGFVKNAEYTFVTKNGREISAELSASVLKDASGNPTSFVSITKDITERRKAEEAIKNASEEWQRTFDAITDFAFIIDRDYRLVKVNKAVCNAFKKEQKELIGKRCFEVVHGTDKPWPNCPHTKMLATGKEVTEEVNDPNLGLPLLVTNSPIFNDKHELTGAVHLAKDITEHKKAEDELRQSERKYRTLLENVPQKIFLKDRNSVYVSCNENYARDLKIESSEIIGKTDYDFYPEKLAEKYRADDKRIMESGKTEDIEEEYIEDGQKACVQTVKTPVKDENDNVVGILGIFWDITERKQVEEALRESEQRFRCLVEDATAGVGIIDLKGKFTYVNETLAGLLGCSVQELAGRPFKDFLHPDDRGKVVRLFLKGILLRIQPRYLEFRVIHKDGRVLHLTSKPTRLLINGKTVGFQAIIIDITERKKAEEKIRESEEKYRNLFENAKDLILTVDFEGKVTSANSTLLEYGYDKSEVVGKNVFNFLPKEVWQQFRDGYKELAQGKPSKGEFRIKSKVKQGYTTVEYRSNPIIKDNKVVGLQTILRDITERKEMEEKLRQYSEHLEEIVQKRTSDLLESETRYSVLVEEASDGVVILQDGKLVFTNKKAAEIVNYTKDEVIGLSFEKFVDVKYLQYATELYLKLLQGARLPITTELELIAKTGKRVPVEISGTLIQYQGRPAALVIMRDTRERKQIEEQRSRLEKLAAIGELATMVGHDLRNPLQSIENATYFLNQELPKYNIPPKAMEIFQVINSSIDYADKIIRDLQDFSATKPPALEKTDINTIVKETLSQTQIPKNIELHTELDYLPEIKADKDQIKRAFLNLTQNAIQAMKNGGKLTVSTKKTEAFVEVSFKDTGVGIPKENMKKLFTPLYTTKAKGMGMGLAICKRFVENHNGSIEIESQEGKGSTFTVKLPNTQPKGGENR